MIFKFLTNLCLKVMEVDHFPVKLEEFGSLLGWSVGVSGAEVMERLEFTLRPHHTLTG
jgi:hypothetical protein